MLFTQSTLLLTSLLAVLLQCPPPLEIGTNHLNVVVRAAVTCQLHSATGTRQGSGRENHDISCESMWWRDVDTANTEHGGAEARG